MHVRLDVRSDVQSDVCSDGRTDGNSSLCSIALFNLIREFCLFFHLLPLSLFGSIFGCFWPSIVLHSRPKVPLNPLTPNSLIWKKVNLRYGFILDISSFIILFIHFEVLPSHCIWYDVELRKYLFMENARKQPKAVHLEISAISPCVRMYIIFNKKILENGIASPLTISQYLIPQ